jgi:hypothetical protein
MGHESKNAARKDFPTAALNYGARCALGSFSFVEVRKDVELGTVLDDPPGIPELRNNYVCLGNFGPLVFVSVTFACFVCSAVSDLQKDCAVAESVFLCRQSALARFTDDKRF